MVRLIRYCIVCLALLPAAAFAAGTWTACEEGQPREPDFPWLAELTPGLTWDSWRSLLHQDWSPGDRVRPGWSDTAAMLRAADAAPLDTAYQPAEWARTEQYIPQTPATAEQSEAYAAAAALFHRRRWGDAIVAFDAIAARPDSPYAAAAAYSAARAALDMGAFADGIARVGRIIADPAMQEMHQAAHHLVGTIAYQTGAAPLVAARLEDITHLLLAPHELRCRNTDLRSLMDEADLDFRYVLSRAFPSDRFDDFPPWSQHTRGLLAHLAQSNPLADLALVLAAWTPFDRDGAWVEPFYPQAPTHPGLQLADQKTVSDADKDGAILTAHARQRAQETGNPLWAYALAIRTTDLADLPILQTAEAAAAVAPIAQPERDFLAAWMVAHQARLLLMAGREDAALVVARRMSRNPLYGYRSPDRLMTDGGTRSLLAKRASRSIDGVDRCSRA